MKKSLKLIVAAFIITALFTTTHANAQITPSNSLRLSIGLETAEPTGNLRIGSNFSLGGTIHLQYGLTDNFSATLASGAYHFFSKINPATGKRFNSFGVIPIKAGLKEFFIPNIYVAAEAGVGYEQTDNHDGQTKFIWTPGVGYANEHWDVGVRYESFSGENNNYGLVALRIAYGFRFLTKK